MFFDIVFISLILLLLGVTLCFSGYRFFLFLIPIWGFFAGFAFVATGIQDVFGGGFLQTTLSWVLGLFAGVLLATIAYFYYYGAVVVLAASVGYEIGTGIVAGFEARPNGAEFLVGVLCAIVLSVLAVYFNLPKMLIIALTALAGAATILTALFLAADRVSLASLQNGDLGDYLRLSWGWLIVYLALAALGMLVQERSVRKFTLRPQRRAPSWS